MSPGKYLLIDAATPLIQVVAIGDGGVLCAKSRVANAATEISPLTRELLWAIGCTLDDFVAMVFCNGPGSALGLRTALISLKTWLIFSRKPCRLLEYCSLDMCLGLNPSASGACARGIGDGLIVKLRGGDAIKILSAGEETPRGAMVFLETRRAPSGKNLGYAEANYTIGEANFDILSLCQPSDGELADYGSIAYKKWEGASPR